MMRRRATRRPEPLLPWVRPEGGHYRGTGSPSGPPPVSPVTAEGIRRLQREERERAEAEDRTGRADDTGAARR